MDFKLKLRCHLSHEDLGPLDKNGGAGYVKSLLQTLQAELLHLLIATLHLHGMVRQHGDLLHVLGEGETDSFSWVS